MAIPALIDLQGNVFRNENTVRHDARLICAGREALSAGTSRSMFPRMWAFGGPKPQS